jgi:hypothetical protein
MGRSAGGEPATRWSIGWRLLKQGKVLHADETPVQQLDPGKGKTKRAYMWAYRSNDLEGAPRIVVFDYQTSRSGQHARNFLQDWRGHLMVDDYGGYKASFRQGVTELACLAHCRRKFFDLHAAGGHPVAAEALRRIGELYAIEAGATMTMRGAPRATPAGSDAEAVGAARLVDCAAAEDGDGSGLARAIDYSLKRWPALIRYVDSGHLPIDNNMVENAIRPITLGRRNWLFTGSERAGRRAAAIQSLLATAKLNGLEPYAWLKDTLENSRPGPTAGLMNSCRSGSVRPGLRPLNLGLLRDFQRVIYLDSKVSNGALQFGMAEQYLHCPQVFRASCRSAWPWFGASCACHRPSDRGRWRQPSDGRSGRTAA